MQIIMKCSNNTYNLYDRFRISYIWIHISNVTLSVTLFLPIFSVLCLAVIVIYLDRITLTFSASVCQGVYESFL